MTEVWLRAALWVTKTFGLWPVTRCFRYPRTEAAYATSVANAFFVPRYLPPNAEAPSPTGPMPGAVALGEREG